MTLRKSVLIVLLLGVFSIHLSADQRIIVDFNDNWKFAKGPNNDASMVSFNESGWANVKIPHDWAISGPFDPNGESETGKLPWKGEGWYRKHFTMNPELKEKTVYLIFDGVMAFPKIYLNGKLAGQWDYGYNSFYIDITDMLNYENENVISVHADTREHDSRWYPGAGIFRNIRMIIVNPVHVDVWGTFISTPTVSENWADVRIRTKIINKSGNNRGITLKSIVLSDLEKEICSSESEIIINSKKSIEHEQWITLSSPHKWDIENPYLYTVKTEIISEGKILDSYFTRFGVRSMHFTANDGFYLNGRRVQFKGVNLHHDLGPLGAAFNKRAMQRQLEIMKDMGCNAVRTSHNVPAPELLDLCDEMGLLVLDEIYDKWDKKGGFLPENDFFESAERNVENFVRRDRNHPSIFLWSIGNEIGDIQANAPGSYDKIVAITNYFRKNDPTRPITMVTDNMSGVKWRWFDFFDVHSWNYGRRYLPARQAEPNKPVIISESASTISTRGFYELPLPKDKEDYLNKELQISSYDMNAPWWAEPADLDFAWQEQDKFVCGEFVWTGFDYIGEPTPYNSGLVKEGKISNEQAAKSSYFGIVDLCGIPKDRYYLYKSLWKPEETTIHILPHWNLTDPKAGMLNKPGETVPVFVYTNGDNAELFLNGKSLGERRKIPDSKNIFERYRLMWNNVKYEPGELKVIAYKDGKILGEKSVTTSEEPAKIKLTPDRKIIKSDGVDLIFITVEAVDNNMNFAPLADNKITFDIEGPAEIAGVGNGNPQSLEPFQTNTRKLFFGKAMLILKSIKDLKGNITVKASSEGLKTEQIDLLSE